MSDFLTSVVAVVLGLGIMILVHEWGHFLAAKWFGVRVDIFSIGFGPRLWGRKRGDTDYRLSALPLGGYVKMAGDNPAEERSGDPAEFLSKARWQRGMIAAAGPLMNALLAVVLVAALYKVGIPQPAYVDDPVEVAGVLKDSPAEKAGLQVGDRIVELIGVKNPTWNDALLELFFAAPGKPVAMVVERDHQRLPLSVKAGGARGGGDQFLLIGYPIEPVIIGRLTPGHAAERAGLQLGDQIVAFNQRPVSSPVQLAERIQEVGGRRAEMVVRRGPAPAEGPRISPDGPLRPAGGPQELRVEVQPTYGDPGDGRKRWQIGISFRQQTLLKSYPLVESIQRSVWFNTKWTYQIIAVVAELFEGRASIRQIGGPLEIARQSGQAARQGPVALALLMAVVSLNLGILNLLPIPILDGGHILLLAIEGALRRDLSLAVKERVVQVGLVFLLFVFAIVMYNDILKLLPNR